GGKWWRGKVVSRRGSEGRKDRGISAAAIWGSAICQTICGIGRHCQNSRINAKLASRTYVLRSIETGTKRVHQRLNGGRALTLCCTANSDISRRVMISACTTGAAGPLSMVLGTARPETKLMA